MYGPLPLPLRTRAVHEVQSRDRRFTGSDLATTESEIEADLEILHENMAEHYFVPYTELANRQFLYANRCWPITAYM